MDTCFIAFDQSVQESELPEKFTFPFHYTPHALSILAANDLQNYLENQNDFEHDFGFSGTHTNYTCGKMFGILVVKNKDGELGYLAAYSGKLAGDNKHKRFVPSIFDALNEEGFFRKGEKQLNNLNAEIKRLEEQEEYLLAKENYRNFKAETETQHKAKKTELKKLKKDRKQKRAEAEKNMSTADFEALKEQFIKESLDQQYEVKCWIKAQKIQLEKLHAELSTFESEIKALKNKRKKKSADLQQQLFDQYAFLNAKGKYKDLQSIFAETKLDVPPGGAGDCAAPKLLQYAYLNHYTPIAMAEFWWGKSPEKEVRKHRQFYPACKSKCQPILGHMLQGLTVEPNPLSEKQSEQQAEFIFEDDWIAIVNKPAEMLSVPGKEQKSSVLIQMQKKYGTNVGPLLVHRLDMSTSGLLVVAKTKEAHRIIQEQFTERKVNKRYVALLDGVLNDEEVLIDLPLRVDLDNRPQQVVCYEYGKPAQTRWKKLSEKDGRTLVAFFPITGRTHQLRVHAAHSKGLNTPIVGDDLYGTKDQRLHLHAASISFTHPHTGKKVSFSSKVPF
uniref:RluA family pseudouridine synthase n=1 Tax=uncultured Draconibacterium sp. TaxID=1573823 RepID=UPI003217E5D0